MAQSNKVKNKNQKKRRWSGKNIFWLVMSKRGPYPILYSRKPYLVYFNENHEYWFSVHSECYPNINTAKRLQVDSKTPVPVKLIICNDNPDMYIQRYKDCLFIKSRLETYYRGVQKVTEVPHGFRISNKLFPDVTEESGIVGVKIVKI